MEEETNDNESYREPLSEPVEKNLALHTVTPLSKYLAMVLFIAMPFIGGWVGYQYGVDTKVVEIEKKIVQENEKLLPETKMVDENWYEALTFEEREQLYLVARSHVQANSAEEIEFDLEFEAQDDYQFVFNVIPLNADIDVVKIWLSKTSQGWKVDGFGSIPPDAPTGTYRNEEFGFEIKIPNLQIYPVELDNAITFMLDVPNTNWSTDSFSAFAISSITESEWKENEYFTDNTNCILSRKYAEDPCFGMYLGRNELYRFSLHVGQDCPEGTGCELRSFAINLPGEAFVTFPPSVRESLGFPIQKISLVGNAEFNVFSNNEQENTVTLEGTELCIVPDTQMVDVQVTIDGEEQIWSNVGVPVKVAGVWPTVPVPVMAGMGYFTVEQRELSPAFRAGEHMVIIPDYSSLGVTEYEASVLNEDGEVVDGNLCQYEFERVKAFYYHEGNLVEDRNGAQAVSLDRIFEISKRYNLLPEEFKLHCFNGCG